MPQGRDNLNVVKTDIMKHKKAIVLATNVAATHNFLTNAEEGKPVITSVEVS